MANQFEKVTTEVFVARAKQKHSDRYDYSQTVYKNRSAKVKIICKEHGEFEQDPINHYRLGCGCPKCGKEYAAATKSNRLSTERFIERAKEVHGDKYDYSLVTYTTPWAKIDVVCPDHGAFKSNYLLLKGIGCPKCGIGKAVQTRVDNGYAIAPEQRTVYELYESRVNRITEYNYRRYKQQINPHNYKRARTNGWHLDHKFSKQQGFIEGILPEIIGHWTNLQMLPSKENRTKYITCSVSKQQLLEGYRYIISS